LWVYILMRLVGELGHRPHYPDAFHGFGLETNSIALSDVTTTTMSPLEIPHDLIGQSSLYNHPDPLLRRLRLDDSSGGSIQDLDRTFKGKEVLVLYAGSEHGSSKFSPRASCMVYTDE
jgi:hypothetical protein